MRVKCGCCQNLSIRAQGNTAYLPADYMAWRVVEWFWVTKCNHNGWNSVAESFAKASYLARTKHAQQVTAAAMHILQQSAFLSYVQFEPDHAVSCEQ